MANNQSWTIAIAIMLMLSIVPLAFAEDDEGEYGDERDDDSEGSHEVWDFSDDFDDERGEERRESRREDRDERRIVAAKPIVLPTITAAVSPSVVNSTAIAAAKIVKPSNQTKTNTTAAPRTANYTMDKKLQEKLPAIEHEPRKENAFARMLSWLGIFRR